ncbi:serine dehydratase subunit alpha family protein [Prolixibacteraceae bacterium JC049]|nr:serine dehydratase subunit alpha family protein [Prolixibacteraceae bacterium JC049]
MTTNQQIIELLKREVVPALGCTEPIAAALSGAKAREVLGTIPEKIKLGVSGNILKNAMAVGIPGTGMVGLPIAVALGVVGGNSEKGLEVLSDITDEQIEMAKKMVEEERVCIHHRPDTDLLFIECLAVHEGDEAKVVIRHRHSNITCIEKNGELIFESPENKPGKKTAKEYPDLTIKRIHEFATTAPLDELKFICDGAKMNRAVAQEGLDKKYGMQVGKKSIECVQKGILSDDILTYSMALTAAASDARMDGCTLPVMSNSGSGNQGLTVTLPVVASAEKLNSTNEELVRALILSNLVAIHIKSYLGTLSALCGVLVAATGASAGITYLLGGSYQQIVYAIKNMAGGITGMICDGAKVGCALKVSAGASSAVQTALLAMDDIGISHLDGIIEKDIEKTIKNVARIGAEGMIETDKLILKTMVCK